MTHGHVGQLHQGGQQLQPADHQPVVLRARVLPGVRLDGPADNSYALLNASLRAGATAWSLRGAPAVVQRAGVERRRDRHRATSTTRTGSRGASAWTTAGTARRPRRPTLDKTSGFFSGKAPNGIGRIFDLYDLTAWRRERRRQLGVDHRHRGRWRHGEHAVLDVHERRLPAGPRPPEPRRDRRSAGRLDRA